jgi:hypothetical protein
MPAYAVCLHASSSKGKRSVWTSVEGICGEFSLFECLDDLVSVDRDEDSFPPEITETQAVDLARKGLLKFVISQRGQINKPVVDELEEVRPYHFPLWIYYFRRQGRFLDIKVLDARTGKSAGAKMRVAVLQALVSQRKACRVSRQD